MKEIILIISIVISLNASIFSSTEDDVFELIKEQKYTQALKLIKDDNSFNANKYPFIYYSNNVNLTKELLSKGAKVNARGNYNTTPLMNVKNLEAFKVFIRNKANIHAKINGKTMIEV